MPLFPLRTVLFPGMPLPLPHCLVVPSGIAKVLPASLMSSGRSIEPTAVCAQGMCGVAIDGQVTTPSL